MNKELNILAEAIIKQIPTGEISIESTDGLVVDGIKYDYEEVDVLSVEDDGKYQYGSTIYGIGLLDEERGYGTKGDVLFHIKQDFNRSGSYYSDYYYDYEKPYVVEQVTKVITTTEWEAIE